MKKLCQTVEEAIGGTPIVRLNQLTQHVPVGRWLKEQRPSAQPAKLKSTVYAKLEFMNPAGSVKDRIAKYIVDGFEKSGQLKPGGTIIECTSGNTGAAIAMVAAVRGYKVILTMPDKVSAEKINAMKALGARCVVCPTAVEASHPESYYETAKRLQRESPGSVIVNQYHNLDNTRAHYEMTGPEIWEQMGDKLELFCGGIGTGGTFSGVARYLKEKKPAITCVAADPYGSLFTGIIKTGQPTPVHPYLVEGYGEDMIPQAMDLKMPDDCVQVSDAEAYACARALAQREGILAGGSSGGALFALLSYLACYEAKGGKPLTALVLLPDSGVKYLSKGFNDAWAKEKSLDVRWGADVAKGGIEYLPSAIKIPGA